MKQSCSQQQLIQKALNNGIINFSINTISEQYAELIVQKKWKKLHRAIFGGCNINDRILFILSKADWNKMTILSFWSNSITCEGIKYLSSSNWKNLQTLTLSYNSIGDKGCFFLSRGQFKKLKQLKTANNLIANEGIRHLIKAEWKQIQIIDFSNSDKIRLQQNWQRGYYIFNSWTFSIANESEFKYGHSYLCFNNLNFGDLSFLYISDWKQLKYLILQSQSLNNLNSSIKKKFINNFKNKMLPNSGCSIIL